MNNKAFSLIELSIVLIIIGLLVAGITGGASLVDSAKVRRSITKFRDIEQQILAFRTLLNRFPGDCNGDLTFTCTFPAPYDGSDKKYGIPNDISAKYVDMYLNNISNFKPENTDKILSKRPWDVVVNNINAIPNMLGNMYPITFVYGVSQGNEKGYRYQINENRIFLAAQAFEPDFEAKFLKKIDLKIDDGRYNYGTVRGACFTEGLKDAYFVSYDDAAGCHKLIYQTNIDFK